MCARACVVGRVGLCAYVRAYLGSINCVCACMCVCAHARRCVRGSFVRMCLRTRMVISVRLCFYYFYYILPTIIYDYNWEAHVRLLHLL